MTQSLKIAAPIGMLLLFLASSMVAYGQQPLDTEPPPLIERQVFKVSPAEYLTPGELTHPLVPALQLGYDGIQYLRENVQDYTCRLVSRERINGKLRDHEYMNLKIRQPKEEGGQLSVPFSVYLNFLGPNKIKGREVLFVQGRDDGKMWARNGGSSNLQDVTMALDPFSERAMRDHRYPLTEIGLETLARRLIEVGHESLLLDRDRRECEVKAREGAKINGKTCRVIQVKFPVKRPKLRFHLARIFVEEDRPIPVRYEAYGWPPAEGQPPTLLEEYTYLDVKLNVGLTNRDFDRENPTYKFYRSGENQQRSDSKTAATRATDSGR